MSYSFTPPLLNDSAETVDSTLTELVTAANNTNGVLITGMNIHGSSAGDSCAVKIGAAASETTLALKLPFNVNSVTETPEFPFVVPAGERVTAQSGGAYDATIFFKVL